MRSAGCDNQVDPLGDKFARDVGKPLIVPSRPAILERDILAFDKTKFTKAVLERRHIHSLRR